MNLKPAQKRRGLATIVTSMIMISAVCCLGGAGVVWSQSLVYSQPEAIANIVDNRINKLNESLNFESVYCNDNPCETIIVVITNNGKIRLDVSEISISNEDLGFNKIHIVSNGKIMPYQSIAIPINDPIFSSYGILDVMSTTSRGNIIQMQIST